MRARRIGTRSMVTRSGCVKLTKVSVLYRGSAAGGGDGASLSRRGAGISRAPECEARPRAPECRAGVWRPVNRAPRDRASHVEFSQEAEMNTYTTVPSGE